MPKINKVVFEHNLLHIGLEQGKRCKVARGNANGDIIAAAIGGSLLINLRHMAGDKLLSRHDIQFVIDAFMDGAKMHEVEQPMGGTRYARIGEQPITGDEG